MSTIEMVTIAKGTYLQLLSQSDELSSLEGGGIDDWEWYSESMKDRRIARDCNERGNDVKWEAMRE